ncbi:MAG TPA: beta-propeller fold lactonase family protein, partial [Solirubrobacteraceae bacterium]|nr:beta-propeller fold lactonase family protein [Solirubrobacteraceae bacterium]
MKIQPFSGQRPSKRSIPSNTASHVNAPAHRAQGLGPFGSEFRPAGQHWQGGRYWQNHPSQLYVTNAHNGAGAGTVSAFDVSRSGLLSSIGASPVADLQTAPCWLTISANGEYLFAVNTGSGTVSSYRIEPEGAPVLIASTEPLAAGAGAVDPRLSPDGRTLYVNASRADEVLSFAVAAVWFQNIVDTCVGTCWTPTKGGRHGNGAVCGRRGAAGGKERPGGRQGT